MVIIDEYTDKTKKQTPTESDIEKSLEELLKKGKNPDMLLLMSLIMLFH